MSNRNTISPELADVLTLVSKWQFDKVYELFHVDPAEIAHALACVMLQSYEPPRRGKRGRPTLSSELCGSKSPYVICVWEESFFRRMEMLVREDMKVPVALSQVMEENGFSYPVVKRNKVEKYLLDLYAHRKDRRERHTSEYVAYIQTSEEVERRRQRRLDRLEINPYADIEETEINRWRMCRARQQRCSTGD